jgi:hypothetical protein
MVTSDRKTPYITDDPDTIQFAKYYLHNKIKSNVFSDLAYDESLSF